MQLTTLTPKLADNSIDIAAWRKILARQYTKDQCTLIDKTLDYAKEVGVNIPANFAQNAYCQGLQMASVLVELNAAHEAVIAALLFEIANEEDGQLAKIEKTFGLGISKIIKDAIQMASVYVDKQEESLQVDRLRRMFLNMVNDVKVVLVKLAERVCALRGAKNLSKNEKINLANQTMRIYAPLANRLGIGQLKWEMEDLAFGCLHPKIYKDIAVSLSEKRIEREEYIKKFLSDTEKLLKTNGITAELSGRVKHLYSIYRKMQGKNLSFDQLFDIRAVRILTKNIAACYEALGIIHDKWEPVAAEFDDYIATPKTNGYRSIHTVVIGPADKTIEVQIRTFTMHEEAEMGLASHWRYKEGVRFDAGYEGRITWLRNLLEWQRELGEKDDHLEEVSHKVIDERIYVFSPEGAVLDLSYGATPLDFAYAIHTEIGHRCRGAKVDGKIVPLTYKLQTGEKIEILTNKECAPSRDWLRADSGYVCTRRAQQKIKQWFKQQDKTRHAQEGRELFNKELHKLRLKVDCEAIANNFDCKKVEDFYALIATGSIKLQQVMNFVVKKYGVPIKEDDEIEPEVSIPIKQKKVKNGDIVIYGVDNLLINMAGCCRPVIGDAVLGYITQGRGVTVHRTNCKSLIKLKEKLPDRIISVQWGKQQCNYPIDLTVYAKNDQNVLKNITALFANEKTPILAIQSTNNKRKQQLCIHLTIEVQNLEQFSRLRDLINQCAGVIDFLRG